MAKYWYKSWIVLLICLASYPALTQVPVTLTGTVIDSVTGNPLEYATIILTPKGQQTRIAFTQTGLEGTFAVSLATNVRYHTEVFYLGYKDFTQSIKPTTDTAVVFRLLPATNDLSEVTVRDTLPPISRREDTVTYNAKAFYTGRERKVNELIDNLPGLAIDENNEITYQGQPVQDVLVEGKPFFGGNAELAVTGLPADAVDRIQVLENYNPLGFSLSPEDRERIALNIQLRPEKKNIYFGELTGGGGPPRNYRGRADVFNYARSRNLYLIGGSNNISAELLSQQQRWQLLGGPMGMRREGALVDLLTRLDS